MSTGVGSPPDGVTTSVVCITVGYPSVPMKVWLKEVVIGAPPGMGKPWEPPGTVEMAGFRLPSERTSLSENVTVESTTVGRPSAPMIV